MNYIECRLSIAISCAVIPPFCRTDRLETGQVRGGGQDQLDTSPQSVTPEQITQSESKLVQSQNMLGRTEVNLPFDARIGKVFVEKGEFTSPGSGLFEASAVQAVEINAQIQIQQFRPLWVV